MSGDAQVRNGSKCDWHSTPALSSTRTFRVSKSTRTAGESRTCGLAIGLNRPVYLQGTARPLSRARQKCEVVVGSSTGGFMRFAIGDATVDIVVDDDNFTLPLSEFFPAADTELLES